MLYVVMNVILQKKHLRVSPNLQAGFDLTTKAKYRLTSLLCLLLITCTSFSISAQSITVSAINSSEIIQDERGFIWLATPNGLIRNDSENITTFNSNNTDWPLPFNWINDIELIENNTLLLATETHGLWLFNLLTGQASALDIPLHAKSVKQVIKHQQYYYLSAPYKLYRVNALTLETEVLADDIDINWLTKTDEHIYVASEIATSKIVDKQLKVIDQSNADFVSSVHDTLFIVNGNVLTLFYDNGSSRILEANEDISAVTSTFDKQAFFTISKSGAIKKFDLQTLTPLVHSYPKLDAMYIEKVLHDQTGVLWFLTNQGLKRLIPSLNKNHEKIFDVIINAIALVEHNDALIVGSYGAGIHDFADTKSLPEDINESFTRKGKVITDFYSLGDDLYIATFDGLWVFNSQKKALTRVDFPENNKILLSISHKDNALFLATNSNGVYVIDISSKTVIKHIQGNSLSASETIDVLPFSSEHFWVATSAGINVVNTSTQEVKTINKYGENKVIALLQHQDKIFASTKGDGLFVYNQQGELLSHIGKNLSFNQMTLIQGDIWIGGKPGLYRLNPNTYQLKLVPNSEQYSFTRRSTLHNNTVYVGHYGGILEIPLSQADMFHPNIHISKTTASGKAQLLNRKIHIKSASDLVTLELASLDFRPGQKKQFKYRINGANWYEINGNQLTFTGLSAGDYHIEIMGTNSLGQWSDFKAYTDIEVAYPWYWTTKMKIIYAVAALASMLLALWLVYLRSSSIKYIHQLLNEEIKTHGKSTLIIHRKLNKMRSLLPALANKNTQHNNNNHTELQHIEALINECINTLSVEDSHLEPSQLSGSSISVALPFLANYFHQKYHVLVTLSLNINDESIDYSIQNAIYRIIFEAISAAISNGNSGVFTVSLNEKNSKLWLKITDNEQSFAQFNNKIKFNMAMYYIRQVANKFNATFQAYDNHENGSEIIISIPLMNMS